MTVSIRQLAAAVVVLLSGRCASVPSPRASAEAYAPEALIPGLVACEGGELLLARDRPLVLFVPGGGDRGERYAELGWRFARQGAQAACFRYDDRETLERSADRLVRALEALQALLPPGRITVLGHAQGGLIARRALVEERAGGLRTAPGFTYTLVAVAAPFGGVRAMADCGRTWLHLLTLGTSALLCSLVAGDAWQDLPASSPFIRQPGRLVPEVAEAVGVVTRERDACRRRDGIGACDQSDAVFSLGEQRSEAVERDPRWARVEVSAGHEEIVGAAGTPPLKLIAVLEAEGVLRLPGLPGRYPVAAGIAPR